MSHGDVFAIIIERAKEFLPHYVNTTPFQRHTWNKSIARVVKIIQINIVLFTNILITGAVNIIFF